MIIQGGKGRGGGGSVGMEIGMWHIGDEMRSNMIDIRIPGISPLMLEGRASSIPQNRSV